MKLSIHRTGTLYSRRAMRAVVALLTIIACGGCAKSFIYSEYQSSQSGLQLPERILVYDFAVTTDEVKENQGFFQGAVNDFEGVTSTENEQQTADEVRAVAAEEMVAGIRNLGLPAERASRNAPVPPKSLAITGEFLNVDEGNRLRRLVIGFGKGQSKMDILIRVYSYGLVVFGSSGSKPTKLVEFATRADSGSMPGALVTGGAGVAAGAGAAAVVGTNAGIGAVKSHRSSMGNMTARSAQQAVDYLSEYFWRQGWISQDKVTFAERR
jgi:Domain of unknown function (DUF4410)